MRIAVIGAGPAGSRAAARLARAGHEVSLIDKSFHREKPCGGGIPWHGLSLLPAPPASKGPAPPLMSHGPFSDDALPPRNRTSRSRGDAREDDNPRSLEIHGSGPAMRPLFTARGKARALCALKDLQDRRRAEYAGPWPAPGLAVKRVVFEAPSGRPAEVVLSRPVGVFSRRALDLALVRDAKIGGAGLIERQVVGLERREREWSVLFSGGERGQFDHVVGADGARSFVRRTLGQPFAGEDLSQAVGWYAEGSTLDTMTIRFDARISGYLWVFPRPDHLAIGACASLTPGRAATLWDAARDLLESLGIPEKGLPRYSALIPTLGSAALVANRVCGPGWSLVGDAAGTVDPMTREGISPGIRSSDLLADAFENGAPDTYEALWRRAFVPEFAWAAARRERFFDPGLTERLVRYLDRSRTIRAIMVDLILGVQGYRNLKRRLLRSALPAGLELALSKVGHGSPHRPSEHRGGV